MTRSDLADVIYNRHGGISKREASEMVNLILELIKVRLLKGEKVEISGFGSFEIMKKLGRKSRNPRTGEFIQIPSRYSLNFRPSKLLKKELNL